MNSVGADCTAVALVIDRSKSMEKIASETRQGIVEFIEAQKENKGKTFFTFAQFNERYRVINRFTDVQDINALDIANRFAPRGHTALFDAIGQSIAEMNAEIIRRMDSPEKPEHVIIAFLTDGEDNASHLYTAEKIRNLVKEKESLGWKFLFLSADLLSAKNCEKMGFDSSSTIYFDPSKVRECILTASSITSSLREGRPLTISEDLRNKLQEFKPFEVSAAASSSAASMPKFDHNAFVGADDEFLQDPKLFPLSPAEPQFFFLANSKKKEISNSSSSSRAPAFLRPSRTFTSLNLLDVRAPNSSAKFDYLAISSESIENESLPSQETRKRRLEKDSNGSSSSTDEKRRKME